MQIEYLKTSSIKPYEKNTRKHTDRDVGEIIKSIEKFGFNALLESGAMKI